MLNLIDIPQVVSLPDESWYKRTVNPVVEGWMDTLPSPETRSKLRRKRKGKK